MTHQPKFAAGATLSPLMQHGAAVGCDGPVSSLETNFPGVASCAPGLFPGDRHRANKLASIHDADEADGWVKEARHNGDTEAAEAGVLRRAELQRGRK